MFHDSVWGPCKTSQKRNSKLRLNHDRIPQASKSLNVIAFSQYWKYNLECDKITLLRN